MMHSFRSTLKSAALAAAFCAMASGAALAQDYPTKPVQILSGYTPGLTASDNLARILAPKLEAELGQPFIIENKPGAAGLLAEDYVARAEPDGYTLIAGTSAMTVNAALRRSYTSHETLRPVAAILSSPVLLYVRADSPFNTVQDVIDAAKAEPEKYSFGTSGVGSSAHLVMEIFQSATDTTIEHIPYKGAADVMTALLAGEIDFRVAPVALGDDRIRPLMVFDTKRLGIAPDVPSVEDVGLEGYFETFYGALILAPKDTPDSIVETLYEAIDKTLVSTPELDQQVATFGGEILVLSPQETQTLIDNGIKGWTEVVDRLGIRMD